MNKGFKHLMALVVLLVLTATTAMAQPFLRLPSILGDHMVLQENSTVKIWGWADPNGTVTVTPSWGEPVQTRVLYDSTWAVEVQTPAASKTSHTIHIKTKQKVEETIEDVLIGQVWLCSGQSNMNWSAHHGVIDMRQALEGEQYPEMRLFTVQRNCTGNMQTDCHGEWIVCGEEDTKYFSAVGYFFGRHLYENLQQPIGLINSSWGGTPIELWMSPSDVSKDKTALEAFKQRYAKRKGWRESGLFNAMIRPLQNLHLAGVIWYQGCANGYNPSVYAKQQAEMIYAWRHIFRQENMPFYFVQLAPHGKEPVVGGKTLVREQQAAVAAQVPGVGMVNISDQVEDVTDIHPKYKKQVGARLGNWALAEVYKKEVGKYKQATMKSVEFKGGRAIITFDNAEGGIECRGDAVAHLEIADASMQFKPAMGMVDGEGRLLAWNKQVRKPVAVRYCFNETAIGNLFDAAGLPVAPFRSDAPLITVPKPTAVAPAAKSAAKGPVAEVTKTAVRVEGSGHKQVKLAEGVTLHTNRKYTLRKIPTNMVGFDMLQHAAPDKSGGPRNAHTTKVTALSDGEIYVLALSCGPIDGALKRWKKVQGGTIVLQQSAELKREFQLYALPVKAGEVVTLPRTDQFNDLSLIAVQIDYAE